MCVSTVTSTEDLWLRWTFKRCTYGVRMGDARRNSAASSAVATQLIHYLEEELSYLSIVS